MLRTYTSPSKNTSTKKRKLNEELNQSAEEITISDFKRLESELESLRISHQTLRKDLKDRDILNEIYAKELGVLRYVYSWLFYFLTL